MDLSLSRNWDRQTCLSVCACGDDDNYNIFFLKEFFSSIFYFFWVGEGVGVLGNGGITAVTMLITIF